MEAPTRGRKMVDLPHLWWTLQVLTHVAYLVPLFVAWWTRRPESATTLAVMIVFSLHYHVCLGTDVCLGNLAHAAAVDWCGAGLVSIALAGQLCAFPAAITHSLTLFYAGMMALLFPLLADHIAATVLLMLIIIMMTFARPFVFRVPAPYPGGLLTYFGTFVTLVSLGLFVFPRASTEPVYNATHCLWHIMSALGITIVELIIAREVIERCRAFPFVKIVHYVANGDVYPYASSLMYKL